MSNYLLKVQDINNIHYSKGYMNIFFFQRRKLPRANILMTF